MICFYNKMIPCVKGMLRNPFSPKQLDDAKYQIMWGKNFFNVVNSDIPCFVGGIQSWLSMSNPRFFYL
jgi:hypothetical protein